MRVLNSTTGSECALNRECALTEYKHIFCHYSIVLRGFGVVLMKSNGKRGAGKRLNDSQRLEIISKLQRPNPPSKRAIAREYDIVESSVRKLWVQRRINAYLWCVWESTIHRYEYKAGANSSNGNETQDSAGNPWFLWIKLNFLFGFFKCALYRDAHLNKCALNREITVPWSLHIHFNKRLSKYESQMKWWWPCRFYLH